MTNLEVGDIVLCTVERISNTTVLVNVEKEGDGTIILSEIAPGRIRNIRDYVVPKKKIICKILRISASGNIDLSLRRVTPKDQKELREEIKAEKSYTSILKTILKDKAEKIISEIKQQEKLFNFIEEAKNNPKELEKITGKENAEKILEILNKQKSKTFTLKKQITLTIIKPDGLETIKKILGDIKDAEIKYISAGKYSIKTGDKDIKKADNKIKEILKKIEKQAKKAGAEFSVKEK